MTQRNFLSDVLKRVSRKSLFKREPKDTEAVPLLELCNGLMEDRGEISGLIVAREILERYSGLSAEEKTAFFLELSESFGVDEEALEAEMADWVKGDLDATRRIHFAAEPRSQELIRLLNRVPGATEQLVSMRADLLERMRGVTSLEGLDLDFQHLFLSWFNRGFLEIRRIEWSTSAAILEKIIAYEAVHEISGWDDLRRRVGDPDRRLFAFFHPAMPSEPLIFVEVALTNEIPSAIAPILSNARDQIAPDEAKTAVFYSISNCQKGLRGISFGNFLIKQVVSELQRELANLDTFVTLSPVPALRNWVVAALNDAESILSQKDREKLAATGDDPETEVAFVKHLAALYLCEAKRPQGTAFDPVAHFHLGNGAVLYRIHENADQSDKAIDNSWGIMVNYLYDEALIETNHQAYATERNIATSAEVRGLITG